LEITCTKCKRNKRAVKVALFAILVFLIVWFSIPFTALRVRDSAVMVYVWQDGSPTRVGSGVVVDDGVILTARHVVDGANEIHITTDDGEQIISTEFYKADDTDLGLIIFDCNDMPPKVRLSFCELFVGQTVFGIGSRFILNNSFFQGFVGAKNRLSYTFGSKGLTQLDIAGNPGDSGCGIFNRWGNVVGIVVGRRSQGITFIIPAKVCRCFVAKYKADKAMKECE